MMYPVVSCPNCNAEILLNRPRNKNSWYRCRSCGYCYGSYQLCDRAMKEYEEKVKEIERKLVEIRNNDPNRVNYRKFKRRCKKVHPLTGEELPKPKKKDEDNFLYIGSDEDIEELTKNWVG